MQKKSLSLLTAAAITLGAAGFATSASAAVPAAGLTTATADAIKTGRNVQTVGYYYYGSYKHRRRCRWLYRKGFVYGYYWARRAYYRQCNRRYYPYAPYYGPRIGIHLGF